MLWGLPSQWGPRQEYGRSSFIWEGPRGSPRGAGGRPCLPVWEMQQTWVRSSVGKVPRRRAWRPPPVFWPGESHGQRSLWGCSQGVAQSQTRLKRLRAQHARTHARTLARSLGDSDTGEGQGDGQSREGGAAVSGRLRGSAGRAPGSPQGRGPGSYPAVPVPHLGGVSGGVTALGSITPGGVEPPFRSVPDDASPASAPPAPVLRSYHHPSNQALTVSQAPARGLPWAGSPPSLQMRKQAD